MTEPPPTTRDTLLPPEDEDTNPGRNPPPPFVGQPPPLTLPGASPLFGEMIEEMRNERKAMTKLVERIEGAADMITRAVNQLISHEVRISALERNVKELERAVANGPPRY